MDFPSMNSVLYQPPKVSSDIMKVGGVPGMGNLMQQYREYKKRHRKPVPDNMRNITEASKKAMANIRKVAGNTTSEKPPMVREYEKMTQADFEKMRQEHGFDAVSEFIRNAEYQRITGGNNA